MLMSVGNMRPSTNGTGLPTFFLSVIITLLASPLISMPAASPCMMTEYDYKV